ncbi:MAG: tRNA 2-selenouridine(34) synthase MnmH [Flavobacteriales bacterium]|nr:tRNA 2-selenouridine(34) synthase MnmH [Flavobacteriales bacterium]
MIRALPPHVFLDPAEGAPIIDVRSPGEFARGHIPGAVNVPLFSDQERAVVGTLYKQTGRDAAVLEGLRIVGPKLASIVEQATAHAPERRIRVHCWRGGERSGSVAWLLDKAGFPEVSTMKGGYKAFRQLVLSSFTEVPPLVVLGGYTGTGKTELLRHLSSLDEVVVDLEALADHKGSSFGMLGEAPQPTQEHFENRLWAAFRAAGSGRPIWLEDESRKIGRVLLPAPLYDALRTAPLVLVDMPQAERVHRLVADYGRFSVEDLGAAVQRIAKRLGPQHAKAALEALQAGDLATVARITLHYYDRTYAYGLAQRDARTITTVEAPSHDLCGLALRLKEHAASTISSR